MKKLLLVMSAGLMAYSLQAEVLTPDQALERVLGSVTPMSLNTPQSRPQLVATRNADSQPAVYVYSMGDNRGYMVLSADDQAEPLLGYSDTGSFDAGMINPTMQWWLDEYAAEVKWLRENPSMTHYLPVQRAAKANIAPMVKTKWNQSAPFNDMCPTDSKGTHTVTGCVATAMAQIVNYHQYPKGAGKGSASVTYNGQTYTVDYSATTFDWANMLDDYSVAYTKAQGDAVANLMYACGVSVDMSYGTGASGAVTANVANALVNNFGYDQGVCVLYRQYYTLDKWNDCIYNQLKEYGPVQFAGRNDGGGHSFVCDGYAEGDYFHINWGWGGSSDGFFKLTALDPSSQGIGGSSAGYNSNQYVIGNICPPRADSQLYKAMYVSTAMSVSTNEVTLGSSFQLGGGFYNSGTATMDVMFGYRLVAQDGTTTDKNLFYSTNLAPRYGFKQLEITLPTTLASGVYKLYPIWKIYGENQWQNYLIAISNPQYVNVVVSGTKATLSMPQSAMLTGEISSLDSPFFVGKEFELSAMFKNESEAEYLGNIFAVLFDNTGKTHIASAGNIMTDVLPGESIDVNYSSTFVAVSGQTITPGDYLIAFADEQGRIITGGYRINVEATPEAGKAEVTSLTIKDADKVNATRMDISMDVKCTSGYFIDRLTVFVFPATGGYNLDAAVTPMMYIKAGDTQTINMIVSFGGLEVGKSYFIAVHDGSSFVSGQYHFTVDSITGVESVVVDDRVIDTEVYTTSGVKVSADSLTPGLYIVRERHVDGSVTVTKRLIK